nr:hypothetical protein [Tanacetum cinerariifolium]
SSIDDDMPFRKRACMEYIRWVFWVIRGSETVSDTVLKHDLCELVIAEVRTMITNDSTGSFKSGKERFQEFANNSNVVGADHFHFNPFRQVVDGHDKEIFKGGMIRIPNAFVHDEDCTYGKVACIAHKLKGQIPVGGNQDWSFSEFSFECLKGFNTHFGEKEWGVFLKKTGYRPGYLRKVFYESSIEIGMIEKATDTLDSGGMRVNSLLKTSIKALPILRKDLSRIRALADLGASINLLPLSVWNKLSLPKLSPMCMTLKLSDRSISHPVGVVEDVFVKVGTFHFPADFVVVDFDADPRVPLILKRSFLKTGRALIDVFEGELTLRVGKEELKICEAKTVKSSVDEPPEVELKDLPPHHEYEFSEGDDKLPAIIAKDLIDEEKTALITVLKSHEPSLGNSPTSRSLGKSRTLCTEKGGFTVVKNEENELIPTRLVTGWRVCIDYQKMLKRCEDTHLSLNWEKSHFMVKEGIVLGHKISKNRIEVDKAKVEVIVKLPYPTTVKGVVLRQCQEKHFRPIHYASKTMTKGESNYSATEKEMLPVVYAFEKFWSYLIMNKSIVYTDHSALKYLVAKKDSKARLLRWVFLLQEFKFKVIDTKGAENLAADHLSRLENPH